MVIPFGATIQKDKIMGHYTRWLELKEEHPGKYARDIAGLMHISEAELAFARVGHDAWRLRGEIREILAALESVGETKCICRNEYAVHEQVGAFTNQHLGGHAGLVLNPRALDLRLFLNQWASAFHISETTSRGERQSIQFFDHQGDALLKVYTTDHTDVAAWGDVLTRFIIADNPTLALKAVDAPAHSDGADAGSVEKEWRAMTDVHQFFSLLKRHNLSRQQAFRLVSDDLACKVDNSALAQLLETARQDGNEIMIFVGNRGCVQIFTGVVEKLTPMKGWPHEKLVRPALRPAAGRRRRAGENCRPRRRRDGDRLRPRRGVFSGCARQYQPVAAGDKRAA